MYTTVLMIAMTSVGFGHKCNGCYSNNGCNGCYASVGCNGCYSSCSRRCGGGGLFRGLFNKCRRSCHSCNGCSGCNGYHGCSSCSAVQTSCCVPASCASSAPVEAEVKEAPKPDAKKNTSIQKNGVFQSVSYSSPVSERTSKPVVIYYRD